MTDTATPRNKAAERLYKTAPPWMRIYMEPDGYGLHCDDDDDVASFLSKFDAALAHERQRGREEVAIHVGHTPCCFRPSDHAWADPIRCLEDHQNWPCDAIASPSDEPTSRITVLPPASWAEGAADLLERALYLRSMSSEDAAPVEQAITEHLNHSMRQASPSEEPKE